MRATKTLTVVCIVVAFAVLRHRFMATGPLAATSPSPLPQGIPSRVCEVGAVLSPNGKVALRIVRNEWDVAGFDVPYMATELWLEYAESQNRRRVDLSGLGDAWTRRLARDDGSVPGDFNAAGGFTFRLVQWDPTSSRVWLTDAMGELGYRGFLVVSAEGSTVRVIDGSQPAFSESGVWIASCRTTGLACDSGLDIIDAETGKQIQHLSSVSDIANVTWTGGRVAFRGISRGVEGWWTYDPSIGDASLKSADVPIHSSSGPRVFQTWWPPEKEGEAPACRSPQVLGTDDADS